MIKAAARLRRLGDLNAKRHLTRFQQISSRPFSSAGEEEEVEEMDYDVLVVGGGPAGEYFFNL